MHRCCTHLTYRWVPSKGVCYSGWFPWVIQQVLGLRDEDYIPGERILNDQLTAVSEDHPTERSLQHSINFGCMWKGQ